MSKDSYTDVFAKVMYREAKEGAKACGDHCSDGRRDGSDTVCQRNIRTDFLMSELQKSMRLLLQQDLQQQG